MERFIEEHFEEYKQLIREITSIPAPSGKEEKRAGFVEEYIRNLGYNNVYIDQVNNVIVKFMPETGAGVHLYTAHLDTVFPDEDRIDTAEEDGKIKGPGVGDDTANVAALLMVLKYMKSRECLPKKGVIIAFNSCEEGLGNLKGTRALLKEYGTGITRHIAFDLAYDWVCNRAVGSKRYRFTVLTRGGHSYGDFGEKNAIAIAAKLITGFYQMKTDKLPGKTTYNVGVIEGGTSVNTIAQKAEFLFEYRSDSNESLDSMKAQMEQIIHQVTEEEGVEIEVELIGDRPGMGPVDEEKQRELSEKAVSLIEQIAGKKPVCKSGSTDCNMTLSMGIPAVCYGVYLGGGAHTREEYIEVESLKKGLLIAMRTLQEEWEDDE